MKRIVLPLLLAASVLLAACSGKEDEAHAPSQKKSPQPPAHTARSPDANEASHAVLMQAVFGARYNAARGAAVTGLAGSDEPFVVTAIASTTLPDGRTVLVANADTAGEHGEAMQTHAAPGLLNIYVLKKQGKQWQVLARHENVDELGSGGHIGSASWVHPGKEKTALAIRHGGTWQGQTVAALSLYDVSNGNVRPLTRTSIPIHSDNEGACLSTPPCWEIDGAWKFDSANPEAEYDDLVIDFSGEASEPVEGDGDGKNTERTATLRDGRVRYRFDGNQYVLVEGENPVKKF